MGSLTLSQQQYVMEHKMSFDDCVRRSLQPSVIRAWQRQHGEDPCFATDKRYNCAAQCDWHKECLKSRASWL